MATLYILHGPDKGRTLRIDDEPVMIGRGSDQAPLTDQTISRRHAELTLEDGAWTIRDLRSANGTYVNGLRITEPIKLKHGDQIKLGSTLLTYHGGDSTEQLSGASIPADLVTLDSDTEADEASVVASVASADDSVVMAAPDTAYAVKSWKAVRDLADAIGSLLPPDELLQRVMDIVFDVVPAERGVIFMRDEETKELLPAVVRFRDKRARGESESGAIGASRSIVNHVVETHAGVLSENTIKDRRFRLPGHDKEIGRRSVICAPIIAREAILGVIHLDSRTSEHTYNQYELRLITAIGYQTGLAIENARLVQMQLERERLAATGETVAYLSHSIKNILQGMRAGGDLVQRGLDHHDFIVTTKGWGILDRNLDKVYTLMLNMLAFSKQREPQLEILQVNKIVRDVIDLVHEQAEEAGIKLTAEFDELAPMLPVDYDGLHQAVLNLASNAIDALNVGRGYEGNSGEIHVTTRYVAAERCVEISVSDNGPGVAADQRDKIFEPFHSTKGHGGTGLGLAVARKNVRELGGTLDLLPDQGDGCTFLIKIPTADARMLAPGDTQPPTS